MLVLESGTEGEDPGHEALNTVEMAAGSWQKSESDLRDRYHHNLTVHWDGATQPWAGKSAPFDAIDYAPRDWVALSGWPISPDTLDPYIRESATLLNLGPMLFDAALWQHMGRRPPEPDLATGAFRTMFWQFARSRRSATDIMRFGADYLADPPPDVRVLTDATVTRLRSTDNGRAFVGLDAQTLSGRRLTVNAPICVLAASAIENARLLLLSRAAPCASLNAAICPRRRRGARQPYADRHASVRRFCRCRIAPPHPRTG